MTEPMEATSGFEDEAAQRDWLASQFEGITDQLTFLSPSEWAESSRYLPDSVTPMPGYYRFSVAPYLREIVDCMSVDSPVREVAVMKGVQICATVGLLENVIGYCIDHVKSAPVMMVTADAELAKIRMESYITPMLQHSGLMHLVKSSDEKNARKTGKTDKKLEWVGGGFLIPFGAQNANKLRSISIRFMLRDEIDGWPLLVGRDGDPIKLSTDRTASYETSRKILDLSTPLLKGTSKIHSGFLRGDQRHYYVCCLRCGYPQPLVWRHTDPNTGEVSGIVWETHNGQLVHDSVRYACVECGHGHTNDDKTRMLSPDNGAEWRPTAEPVAPHVRSYHVPALLSPVGMQTWAACVHAWRDAWDDEHNRVRDVGKLQIFYNNVLGEPFEPRGEGVRFQTVSEHRREYSYGTVPNEFVKSFCGSPVLMVSCAVDVHKESLKVAVWGWSRGRRVALIDYWTFEGDTERLDDSSWNELRELIENKVYTADDGRRYRIAYTLIDAGYRASQVYDFCGEYLGGVAPVRGRNIPVKGGTVREFSHFITPLGNIAYTVTADLYKDRWAASLRRSWNGHDLQPESYFNAPEDITDAQLKELTAEKKVAEVDKSTGEILGYKWERPSGSANELWDLLVYGSATLDIIAWDVCRNEFELEQVEWSKFFDFIEANEVFMEG